MKITSLLKLIYTTIFILFFLTAFTQTKANKVSPTLKSENYILILSSYQYNNPWSTAIAKKIQQQLEQENPELIFRTVYASLEIPQTMLASRLNMQKAFSQARLTPTVFIPRILVLIGDESWMLYRIMNLRGRWEKVPVVLCGVHDEILKDYTDFFPEHSFADSLMLPVSQSNGQLQITGVLKDNVSYNRSRLLQTNCPALKEIIYISKGNYNDEYTWNQEHRTLSVTLPHVKLSYFNSLQTSEDSICQYINQLSSDSAILLFNSPPAFLASLQLPALSIYDNDTKNNNILGGYYAMAEQFARQTTKLVMQIYRGTPLHELPLQYVQDHRFYFNAQNPYLSKSDLQDDKLFNLTYYNTPPPFFIRHMRLIISILVIISISVTGSMIYFKTRRYQNHIQRLLVKYKILHEKFQIIYDHMPMALLIFNEDGKLLHRNPAAKKLQAMWDWKTPKNLDLFSDLFKEKRLQDKILRRENINQILPVQQGKYQARLTKIYEDDCDYFRLIVRYIPDQIKNTENILVMLIDNSAIYREKVANKRIRSVFNFAMSKASIGIAEYNLYTKTGMATDSWYRHMGLQDKQQSALAVFQHIDEKDRTAILQFYKQAYQGKSNHFVREIKVIHKDHSVHYIREQIKVMEYHPEKKQIWVTELNQNIDQEKELTAETESAIQKAQEAELLKNTFIANMSHEIRSPLNAIVGFSNLIATTKDIEVRKEMIHYIEENNEVLLRQVNDIIDLSKIESGSITFNLSETDINELFKDITITHQIKAGGKKLNITCNCPIEELHILTDKIRIRQVISNFMTNAVKYTEQGDILLGYRLEEDGLYVYVTDTGIGIPKEQVAKVFNRFYRATQTHQGYGLGLAITQAVIEGLKGKIGVISEEGQGSTFWFKLPAEIIQCTIAPATQNPERNLPINIPSGQKPHILVVEDDASNFLLMQFMLKEYFLITHAWNGEEAIKLYQEGKQDLILMDIKMPKKNGYETTREIRSLPSQVPIIATTAFAFSTDETKAIENGFNAFLTKPLAKQSLLETIHYWLNHAN